MDDVGVLDGSGVWGSLFDGVLGDRAKVMEESQLPQTGDACIHRAGAQLHLCGAFPVEGASFPCPAYLEDAQCMCIHLL